MDYIKKSFISDDKHNLSVMKTQCHSMSPMVLIGCGITFIDAGDSRYQDLILSVLTENDIEPANIERIIITLVPCVGTSVVGIIIIIFKIVMMYFVV